MAIYEINNIPGPIDFECNDNLLKRTLQNAKNLLVLHMGELPYDRLRGFDRGLYHLPVQRMQEQLFDEVQRAMLWEPDVQVRQVEAVPLEDGEYYITAQLEISFEEGQAWTQLNSTM